MRRTILKRQESREFIPYYIVRDFLVEKEIHERDQMRYSCIYIQFEIMIYIFSHFFSKCKKTFFF